MDQKKIGSFLRELRTEKNLTQEQLAEKLNVAGRTVSRWENGNNMPDLSIIVEIADFYDVDIREILNGERKSENMNEDLKETLETVAEYTSAEKKKLTKDLFSYTIGSVILFGLIFMANVFHFSKANCTVDDNTNIFAVLGLVYSVFSVIKLKQLTGEMKKSSFDKFIKVFFIVLGVILVISITGLLFAIGILSTDSLL